MPYHYYYTSYNESNVRKKHTKKTSFLQEGGRERFERANEYKRRHDVRLEEIQPVHDKSDKERKKGGVQGNAGELGIVRVCMCACVSACVCVCVCVRVYVCICVSERESVLSIHIYMLYYKYT